MVRLAPLALAKPAVEDTEQKGDEEAGEALPDAAGAHESDDAAGAGAQESDDSSDEDADEEQGAASEALLADPLAAAGLAAAGGDPLAAAGLAAGGGDLLAAAGLAAAGEDPLAAAGAAAGGDLLAAAGSFGGAFPAEETKEAESPLKRARKFVAEYSFWRVYGFLGVGLISTFFVGAAVLVWLAINGIRCYLYSAALDVDDKLVASWTSANYDVNYCSTFSDEILSLQKDNSCDNGDMRVAEYDYRVLDCADIKGRRLLPILTTFP